MIGAAIGATALNSAIDYGIWSAKSNKTFKQQRQLAEEAYERQLDFWNKQNAYNDPSQQVHRLRRAGLNPAMLNGNSVANTAGGLSSTSTPTPVSPHSSSPKVEDAVHTLSSIMVNQKQTGFIDKQTEAMAQNILNLIIERDIKEIARDLNMTEKEIRNLEYESLYEAYYGKSIYGGDPTIKNNELSERIANIRKDRERMESEIGLNDSKSAATDYSVYRDSQYLSMEQELLPLRKRLLDAQSDAELASAERDLKEAAAVKFRVLFDQNKDRREQGLYVFDKQIAKYAVELGATNSQLAEISKRVAELWYDEDRNGVVNAILDFIHNNVRLAGSAAYGTNHSVSSVTRTK